MKKLVGGDFLIADTVIRSKIALLTQDMNVSTSTTFGHELKEIWKEKRGKNKSSTKQITFGGKLPSSLLVPSSTLLALKFVADSVILRGVKAVIPVDGRLISTL